MLNPLKSATDMIFKKKSQGGFYDRFEQNFFAMLLIVFMSIVMIISGVVSYISEFFQVDF